MHYSSTKIRAIILPIRSQKIWLIKEVGRIDLIYLNCSRCWVPSCGSIKVGVGCLLNLWQGGMGATCFHYHTQTLVLGTYPHLLVSYCYHSLTSGLSLGSLRHAYTMRVIEEPKWLYWQYYIATYINLGNGGVSRHHPVTLLSFPIYIRFWSFVQSPDLTVEKWNVHPHNEANNHLWGTGHGNTWIALYNTE